MISRDCRSQVFSLLSRAAHHHSAAERLCVLQHHMVHEVRLFFCRVISHTFFLESLILCRAGSTCARQPCLRPAAPPLRQLTSAALRLVTASSCHAWM